MVLAQATTLIPPGFPLPSLEESHTQVWGRWYIPPPTVYIRDHFSLHASTLAVSTSEE